MLTRFMTLIIISTSSQHGIKYAAGIVFSLLFGGVLISTEFNNFYSIQHLFTYMTARDLIKTRQKFTKNKNNVLKIYR